MKKYIEEHKKLVGTISVLVIVISIAYILGVRVHFFAIPAEAFAPSTLTAQAAGSGPQDMTGEWQRSVSGPTQWNGGNSGGFTISVHVGGWTVSGPPSGATYGVTFILGNANAPTQPTGGGKTGNGGTPIIIKHK